MKIFLLFSLLFLISCNSDDDLNRCSFDDPIANLPWLQNEIDKLEQFDFFEFQYIVSSNYKGGTVFIFANCCPVCNSAFLVYNCEGEVLGSVGDGNIPDNVASEGKLIWKSPNNECIF